MAAAITVAVLTVSRTLRIDPPTLIGSPVDNQAVYPEDMFDSRAMDNVHHD